MSENTPEERLTAAYEPGQMIVVEPEDNLTEQLGALLDSLPHMEVRLPTGGRTLKILRRPSLTVGTQAGSDLQVPEAFAFVSRQHFQLQQAPEGYRLKDLGSRNGTSLNGRPLPPHEDHPLQDGDVIRIGDENGISFLFHDPRTKPPLPGLRLNKPQIDLRDKARFVIGRNPDCDLVLDSPQVPGQAVILSPDGGLQALGEGVLVNAIPQTQTQLKPNDRLEVGPYLLVYHGDFLTLYNSRGYRLDLVGGYKEVKLGKETRRLLDDINLSILPHEFVALVGGSGAGKSTLMDGLNGFRPISGRMIVNERNFYQHYDEFRPHLGYVPQYDILPRLLTVETALHYAAMLRLPPDVSAAERAQRITEALETVEMNTPELRKTRIRALSGGQRKRVSIAAELLADPKLFFLDEPTSGLDPGLEKKMMLLLRRMADQGRTIILITHATSNILETDQVAFLSGGKMVYYGPPYEAARFFGVGDFADIYERIQNKGEQWRGDFQKTAYYQDYVVKRQGQIPAALPDAPPKHPPLWEQARLYWHQFIVYAQRNLRLMLNDPVSLFVGLIVMPFVALMVNSATQPTEMIGRPEILANPALAAQSFTENYLPASESHIVIFGMAILAVLVGAFAGSNDLLKERSIYLRERLVNLQIPPYIASKYAVFAGFAALQSAAYLFILSLHIQFPEAGLIFTPFLEIWISVFLVVMVGYAFGLLISAVSINNDMALYLVLIVVFFQYISAGAIYNVRGVQPAESISYITPARWGTIAIGTTADVQTVAQGSIVCGEMPGAGVACRHEPIAESELFLPYGQEAGYLLRQWAYLLLMGGVLTLLTYGVLRLYDRLDLRLA